ncbi:MAG: hypothetical protein Q9177_004187 [Variospora cf. flavescens]
MATKPDNGKSPTAPTQNTRRTRGRGHVESTPNQNNNSDSDNSRKSHELVRRSGRFRRPKIFHDQPRACSTLPTAPASIQSPPYYGSYTVKRPKTTIIHNPFAFFSLPPEIRNIVYRNFTHFPRGVVRAKSFPTRLRLFLANRQLHHEASALFYASNVFKFYSAHVLPGDDPFGPNLTRIRNCFVHLNGTELDSLGFLTWYVKEFVNALLPHNALECLLVRALPNQLSVTDPLQQLRGIPFAQVHLTVRFDRPLHIWRPWMYSQHTYNTVQNLPPIPQADRRHQQFLERLMMSEGAQVVQRAESGDYVDRPALEVALKGRQLRDAKVKGGWGTGMELYEHMGVEPNIWLGSQRHRPLAM